MADGMNLNITEHKIMRDNTFVDVHLPVALF